MSQELAHTLLARPAVFAKLSRTHDSHMTFTTNDRARRIWKISHA